MDNKERGLLEYLETFLTPSRKEGFERVLKMRTRYITVVLEDIFQSQNASAILRTCDCFGIQDIHIIENRNVFETNEDVVRGASKWLSIHKYSGAENNSATAIKSLKDAGYKIIATTPHIDDIDLPEFNMDNGKTALVFGTERLGISGYIKEHADGFLKIPMFGFTESLNVSVSAAVILHFLTLQLRQKQYEWRLTPEELEDLKLRWLRDTVKHASFLEKEYYKRVNL